MIKKFIKIFALVAIVLLGESTYANELLKPSLLDTLKKNEEQLQNQVNENNRVDKKISPNFTPALSDNFTYDTIFSGSTITIKKARETELYIQDVNIASGATISSSIEVTSYNEVTGEPQYLKKNVNEAKKIFLREPVSMINGQFFNPVTQPSELSFSLKSDGIIRTAGADDRNESKNILHITDSYAEVLPYSWKNIENASGNFAMGNLTTRIPKYKDENIGRTYICTPDTDNNNRSSRILVFVAQSLSEGLLENEIYKHGCQPKNTAKLDSSGSSRFTFGGQTMYGYNHRGTPDYRLLPHYIAFFDTKK